MTCLVEHRFLEEKALESVRDACFGTIFAVEANSSLIPDNQQRERERERRIKELRITQVRYRIARLSYYERVKQLRHLSHITGENKPPHSVHKVCTMSTSHRVP
jgi:hypothetical protein